MSTLPPEYTARPGAGPHDNGPAFHDWLEELDAEGVPVVVLSGEARGRIERELKPPPKARTELVTITFEVTHANPEAVLVSMLLGARFPRKVVPSWKVVRDA
jgi:hypothetical protein